jgi:hypothetical protein
MLQPKSYYEVTLQHYRLQASICICHSVIRILNFEFISNFDIRI